MPNSFMYYLFINRGYSIIIFIKIKKTILYVGSVIRKYLIPLGGFGLESYTVCL